MSIEAMKQALEALEDYQEHIHRKKTQTAITTLRTAIEQAEKQEPVAWMIWTHGPVLVFMNKDEAMMEFERLNTLYPEQSRKLLPLYTTPPAAQRQWVGLTDAERGKLILDNVENVTVAEAAMFKTVACAIEAKLRELNGGAA